MKIKKELRRWAMLALVLALLFSNTVGASASTGDPTVIVDSYGALYTAIAEAKDGEIIGVKGVISIPSIVTLDAGNRYIVIKRMEANAKLLITGDYGEDKQATFKGFHFDGNGGGDKPVGGTDPFIAISGNAHFSMCEFENCFYESGNGGAVYIGSGNVLISSCRFIDNYADYGGAIFNKGTLTVDSCTFKGNWAEETGGAIYNAGTLTLKYVEIKENTARMGGGLYSNASTEIYNSLIWSNTASIHGSDLANEGSLSNYTTDEEYNNRLDYYNLYYAGWEDELNTTIGGAGEYKKFLTTDVDPSAPKPTDPPVEPEPPVDPTDPNPEEPDKGDGDGGENPTTPPEEPTTPDEGDKPTDPPTTPPDKDPVDPDPKPSTPSDAEQGGNIDNSTTDNSDHSTTDNSQHSSNVSNLDNSSQVGSTDNSRSESSKTENSNNTTYNYYQTKQDKGSTGASQSPSQPIAVNVTVPQAKEPKIATQEPTEASQSIAQNIHIEAEGVNVRYEYTADGVIISISPHTAPEIPKEVEAIPTALSTVATPQEPKESSNSWVDYVSMFLLTVLVLGELRDRFRLKKGA